MALRYLFSGSSAARAFYTRSAISYNIESQNTFIQPKRFYGAAAELNVDSVTERVVDVVKKFHKVDPARVTANAHFSKELGLDSLDAVELVMAIEDEFALEVPESEQENLVSVDAVINYVLSNPNAK
eukprot:CAMPEP_0201487692 /NCGR_PEP_ID=MMETSP0151_2-20130828/15169_1 /ASSEMBLY_ACC=CAM_ASM_000257 /TAXON_ID=200890 /ORGANISM="Paramoeba atlantica, Strain 621/1 / CCAP 1560/9" /LENGTH=126 /DNA_ID=CAMNT_0047872815 /DNA_START=49 /DNA_END=429 /DNA_ORIENTATION=+